MKYRQLGTTGTRVSTLCLGAMTFGEADEKSFMHQVGSTESESFRVLDRALDLGINFIDTADVYGQDGLSERVLGKWLASSGKRERIVLATKMRFRMDEGPNGTGASRYRIARTIDASLKRLGTDRIDLYQIHMQDAATRDEEILRALDDAIRAGKLVYVGCSNYAAYRLAGAMHVAREAHLSPFVTLQAQYHLACRDLEREHIPLCTTYGVGLLPWSPLAGGLLTGKYRRGQAAPEGSRMAKWKERYDGFDRRPQNWTIVDALVAVAEEVARPASQVALAWLLAKPVVSSVIFGARSVAQLDENAGAADLELSKAQLQRLDEASAIELGYPYDFIRRIDGTW
ncbi:MAG: aldo/keto reductase [Deltaproteobacteria bacterium]|nr:aldo/keto reductase [Deltaproteobacteria bacterium]